MPDIVVYGFAPSTHVRTARLALAEKGIDYELATVEFGSEELLKLHPFGKIPAFAPPIAYLRMTPESERLLANRPAIGRWFDTVSARPSFAATEPSLPKSQAA